MSSAHELHVDLQATFCFMLVNFLSLCLYSSSFCTFMIFFNFDIIKLDKNQPEKKIFKL